jgi:hypothetical protein
MQDIDDDRLDMVLSRHLSAELDPQLGRAIRHFREPGRLVMPQRSNWHWRMWAGMALAASVAVSWMLYSVYNQIAPLVPNPAQIAGTFETQPADATEPVTEFVSWRSVDEGAVLLKDNRPARRIRQQVVQRYSWYDPAQQTTVELTVPQEQVVLVGQNSY